MVDAFREISTQQRLRELDNLYGNNDELMAKKYAQAMNVKPESARQRVHAWRQGAAMRPAAYNALKRHAPRLPR
jgi:hypothetical protein